MPGCAWQIQKKRIKNKMYKKSKPNITTLKVNTSYQGETIEKKIRRIENNKEPIKDGAPLIYTERKEGVRPEYNIKTDRWEVAADAMDAVSRAKIAKRESPVIPITEANKNGGPESIQATE